jgi:hypothetical protein
MVVTFGHKSGTAYTDTSCGLPILEFVFGLVIVTCSRLPAVPGPVLMVPNAYWA